MQNEITIGTDLYHDNDGLKLNVIDYANQGNGVLGIRGAGKTYTAMKIAEALMDADIPILVFDPIGVWKNLRIGIDGNAGYPVIVAGGPKDDIPLTPDNAIDILRGAMETGANLVFNFFTPKLATKATWIKIVQTCLEFLMFENAENNNRIRHIFVEEAAEFIPQRLMNEHYRVYSAFEKIARMGRNVGIGYTIINQRAEEINKAILELCALVFLHQQTGKNSLTSIGNWMKIMQLPKEQIAGIMQSLPKLNSGQCFVIGEGISTYAQIAPKKTFHPNPKAPSYDVTTANIPSVNELVTKLLIAGKVNPVETVLNASEPIKKKHKETADTAPAIIRDVEIEKLQKQNESLSQQLQVSNTRYKNLVTAVLDKIGDIRVLCQPDAPPPADSDFKVTLSHNDAKPFTKLPDDSTKVKEPAIVGTASGPALLESDVKLDKCAFAILGVLNTYRTQWFTKNQIACLTCYAPDGGGFSKGLALLRSAKLYKMDVDKYQINSENPRLKYYTPGIKPVIYSVHARKKCKLGKAEREIFEVLLRYPDKYFTMETLAAATVTKYQATGGSFSAAISTLSGLGLSVRENGKVWLHGDILKLLNLIDYK